MAHPDVSTVALQRWLDDCSLPSDLGAAISVLPAVRRSSSIAARRELPCHRSCYLRLLVRCFGLVRLANFSASVLPHFGNGFQCAAPRCRYLIADTLVRRIPCAPGGPRS